MKPIALTGSAGVIGSFLRQHWQRRGTPYRALQRSGAPLEPTSLIGDLNEVSTRLALLTGCDALVHSAFSHVPGRYRGGEGDDPAGFLRENLDVTTALLRDAERLGVKRVVLLSSRAVFTGGRYDAGELADDAPLSPDGAYGELKAATEALAGQFGRNDLVVTVLRPTGVYGERNPMSASKWWNEVRALLNQEPDPAPRNSTEVHGADVSDAIERLLTAPAELVNGRVFNCSDLSLDRSARCDFWRRRVGGQSIADWAPSGAPAPLRLRCDGLAELGWRPGGRARLVATLDALLNAAQQQIGDA